MSTPEKDLQLTLIRKIGDMLTPRFFYNANEKVKMLLADKIREKEKLIIEKQQQIGVCREVVLLEFNTNLANYRTHLVEIYKEIDIHEVKATIADKQEKIKDINGHIRILEEGIGINEKSDTAKTVIAQKKEEIKDINEQIETLEKDISLAEEIDIFKAAILEKKEEIKVINKFIGILEEDIRVAKEELGALEPKKKLAEVIPKSSFFQTRQYRLSILPRPDKESQPDKPNPIPSSSRMSL